MRTGAYPGTFDPPTVAHLAVAEAALQQGGLDAVVLVVSRAPLGKSPSVPSFEDRVAVLEEVAASRPWLGVQVSDQRLIADVVAGFDAVIMGMDKWLQVVDPRWYGGSASARDAAVASLPPVLLAHRPGSAGPPAVPDGVRLLEVAAGHGPVSSTLARAGRVEWMLPEAARFDARTGAWSRPERYRAP
ncbi:MAG TPA: adenylyltransferase/cytidyltransferase family protein [Acidimicrobiales bacterium]|jgi:nicotinate-nucleotide adenylyltransferase|nr:adenylyltransferase/cytidyltransferase family protein [Acidimicrobiales bacterium]